MTRDDVEILSHELLYQGYFRFERYQVRHKLHGGGWSGVVSRELFERGQAAAVLLYDPKRDAVVLIEQFRVGALAAGLGPWLTEIVAGSVNAGETPEATVRREAREEAGLEVQALEKISHQLTTPGGCSEAVAVFCGRVDSERAGGVHGVPQEQEDIRVIVVPAAEAFALRRKGDRVQDSTTMTALLWLELERENLRARWR
ncbi:MAG TPA: NUDIX domain-containing protein [Alphaproteobacteria bacterium]|nr:NUDIX domain-containing protein [Alphaproteobacteria bacterium]